VAVYLKSGFLSIDTEKLMTLLNAMSKLNFELCVDLGSDGNKLIFKNRNWFEVVK